MVLIELEWLGGVEGAFCAQSPRRRAQLVALWREKHQPAQAAAPAQRSEALPPADYMARMKKAYGG